MRNAWSSWFGLALFFGVGMGILAPPARGHDQEPPWLDAEALDEGLYIHVYAPLVIRNAGPFDVKVAIRNPAGINDVVVTEVRFLTADRERIVSHVLHAPLPTQRTTVEAYRSAVEEMHRAAIRNDAAGVTRLARQCRVLLDALAPAVVTDRYHVPRDDLPRAEDGSFEMLVEVELLDGQRRRTVVRPVTIPVHEPLPRGNELGRRWLFDVKSLEMHPAPAEPQRSIKATSITWFAGDQHVHTTYSLDALILDGTTETVTDYAATAELIGLDWLIVTDHSNVHYNYQGTDYYTSQQFDAGTSQAAAYTASNGLLAVYGEEMGAGRTGLFALPSHYLAYPFASVSTGYLANPSSGLIYGLANCEDEQVIIDRVNNAGGFGFIAHPFDSGTLSYAQWDFSNGATGWAGLEIWNDTTGQFDANDQQSLDKWHDLLNAIAGPQGGSLAVRPGYPNRFPVGLGNSDAHEPGLIGATFTYAWLESFSRSAVAGALMDGHCVASNGPLLFADLNGAHTGQVAFLLDGDNKLVLALTTTAEFGPVGDYKLTVYVNGVIRTTVPPSGDPGFSTTVELHSLNLSFPDKYVTVRADSMDGQYHAIANPVWLQFTAAGDANADGSIDLGDFPSFVDCLTGPQIDQLPSCDIMDFDRDNDVDVVDFAAFQHEFNQ